MVPIATQRMRSRGICDLTRHQQEASQAPNINLPLPLAGIGLGLRDSSGYEFLGKFCTLLHSVGHRVRKVVDADANSQRSKFLRITRLIGILPGVAEIHVMADRHLYPTLVIVYAAPACLIAILLVCSAAPNELRARYLEPVVQIADHVEDGII